MCGIYGYVGYNATNETLLGIKKLEYRGYDSAGIAFYNNSFKLNDNIKNFTNNIKTFKNGFNIIKEEGEINKLEKIFNCLNPKSGIAIGHTRWATHGKPSVENAHPHYSENGNWIVVHNGIIENYLELKNTLTGTKFSSCTDTEVVAMLLSKHFNGDVMETIIKVCSMLIGSYALAIIYAPDPNKIYVAKLNSPCVVGYGKNFGVVCSDLNAVTKAEKLFVLNNHNFAVVEKNCVTIFDKDKNEIKLKETKPTNLIGSNELGNYPHFMLKEIMEIPNAITKTVAEYNTFNKIRKELPKSLIKQTKNILIIACGTAYHAGLIGKKLFEENCGIKTDVEIASEFRYNNFKPNKNTLTIFVSQSGETADTIKAVKMSKAYGLKTVAITNVKSSSICFEVDYCLYTSAGPEIAVASTKAYNCQVTMFYLLSAYINAVKTEVPELVFEESKKLIQIANVIKNNNIAPICKEIANNIKNCLSVYMIGRGMDYYTAQEAGLKLKEISYIHCEAYPAGELKHGTISLIDSEKFVFAFITQELTKEKTLSNVNEVISRGGKVIVFSQFNINQPNFFKFVKLPSVEELYMPLVLVTYMQQIAYHTSLAVGNNPDKPRSLAKSVTVE